MKKRISINLKLLTLLISIAFLFNACISSDLRKEIRELQDAEIFSLSSNGQAIVLDGVINSSAHKEFMKIIQENPEIKKINIVNCDGSIDDHINLKLAASIYRQEMDIHLMDHGLIASGGTDLFLAGRKRSRGEDTRIGVHSWAGPERNGKTITATDFPDDDKRHQPYIKYYKSVGFSPKEAEDFYFFTIQSASADDIHWMTDQEILEYGILKE